MLNHKKPNKNPKNLEKISAAVLVLQTLAEKMWAEDWLLPKFEWMEINICS